MKLGDSIQIKCEDAGNGFVKFNASIKSGNVKHIINTKSMHNLNEVLNKVIIAIRVLNLN